MTFYSITFLFFFAFFILLIHFSKTVQSYHVTLLLANIVFYSFWDIRLIPVLFAEICLIYWYGKKLENTKNRLDLIIPIGSLTLILGYFKYFNFFVESFAELFQIQHTLSLEIILPLGISFYTFQSMSYLFDIYYGKIKAEKNFLKIAVYITFFPQISAGPIVKARDFLPQLSEKHSITKENVYKGTQMFVTGLAKKVVIADRIGVAVNAVYSAPAAYNGISIAWAMIGYSIQIYCDFSGYSDMAIGIATILGFDLGENFDCPYLSRNPSEFWKRWHISLSTWFREYVYIPLGGNRKGEKRTYFNLFLTMFLSGLWHGANWAFVLWGALHGFGIALHKFWLGFVQKIRPSAPNPCNPFLICVYILLNNMFVTCLWVFFRAENVHQAFELLQGLSRLQGLTYINPYTVVFTLFVVIAHVWAYRSNNKKGAYALWNLETFKGKFLLCMQVFLIVMFMYVGDTAFIYAQF